MKINYPDLMTFVADHIRYKQHWNKRVISLTDAVWQTLDNHTFIDHWTFAVGSQFKVFETSNFGWIVFGPDTRLMDGSKPIRRIFKV